jgi:hypothetical protein
MDNWIGAKAARIKERQEQAEESRQSGVHEADVISRRGRDVLECATIAAVRRRGPARGSRSILFQACCLLFSFSARTG